MPFVEVLCPNGHRVKVELTPNTPLNKALEEACTIKGFQIDKHELRHNRKSVDLSLSFRLSGLTNHAKLEMLERTTGSSSSVTPGSSTGGSRLCVALRLDNGERREVSGDITPETTLWTILENVGNESEELKTRVFTMQDGFYPVIIYMSQEVVGEFCLQNSTLRSLGVTSGRCLLQFAKRSMDANLVKEKETALAKKNASPAASSLTPPSLMSPDVTTASSSVGTNQVFKIKESSPPNTSSVPFNNPRSVFSEPNTVSVFNVRNNDAVPAPSPQQRSQTLGEMLGMSLEKPQKNESSQPNRYRHDLTNFKFPEETAGQTLYQNEFSEVSHEDFQPCDRQNLAYSLEHIITKVPQSTEELSDEFFVVTEEDVKAMIASYKREERELSESPLMTSSMRESAKISHFSKYPQCIIQFYFPDKTVLQSIFRPKESVHALYKHVQENIRDPNLTFSLYTTPPKIFLKERTKNLIQADLMPMAKVYITMAPDEDNSGLCLTSSLMESIKPENVSEARSIVAHCMSNVLVPISDSSRPTCSGSAPAKKVPKWFKTGK